VALLQVVVRNLMTNALRHSPGDSLVKLSALGTPDGGIEISVAGQGVGIAEDELTKLFQKYFRGARHKGSLVPDWGFTW
jgi:signal transduction histidine kinase